MAGKKHGNDVFPKPQASHEAGFNASTGTGHVKTTSKVVIIGALLIGGVCFLSYSMTRGQAKGAESDTKSTPATQTSGAGNTASGSAHQNIATGGSAASDSGTASVGSGNTNNAPGSAVAPNGNATVINGDKYEANGHGAMAVKNFGQVDSAGIVKEMPKLKDFGDQPKSLEWKTDANGLYIEVPFMQNRETKITPPISMAPFAEHNRKAVVELKGVSPEWQKHFGFQFKSMQLFGDEDRQDGNATAGQEFTILKSQPDDKNYYMAWRSDAETTKEKFAAANDSAVIVIRLK